MRRGTENYAYKHIECVGADIHCLFPSFCFINTTQVYHEGVECQNSLFEIIWGTGFTPSPR